MSKLKKSIKETLNALTKEKAVDIKERKFYKFADTEEEARELLQSIIMEADKSIKKFVWYPEYQNVINWMLGSDKGLFITGSPGVGKTNIVTKLVPVLFHMKHKHIVRPVDADDIKENWDRICNSPVLVIDDVGYEKMTVEKYAKNQYYAFNDIVKLCESKSKTLFLSSNLSKDDMVKRYGQRTVNRLDYLVTAFRVKGESQR